MEDFKISRQSMGVLKDKIHVLFLGLLIGWGHCAIVADEIQCVDDLALNAPEGASVAKMEAVIFVPRDCSSNAVIRIV
jgi:hypothetical protein